VPEEAPSPASRAADVVQPVAARGVAPSCSHRRSLVNDNHFAASLVFLHGAVRFADLVEPEDPGRLDVEPTRCSVRSNLLKRHVRERKARSSEHEAAEERQIDAARHLQQRVEVGNWLEAAEPAGKTGTAATAKHGKRVEQDAVAHQVEYDIDLLRLGDMFRQIAALDFAALGSQLLKLGEAIAIAGRRNHPNAGVDGHLQRGVTE